MSSSSASTGSRPRAGRRALSFLTAPLLAALALLASVSVGAVPAHAEPESARISPTEHFAGLLKAEPEGAAVVVDDSLAGVYEPTELERSLHEAFGQLDAPYYVVASALPGASTSVDDFLAALQDRVGEPGLYVYLRPDGSSTHALAREVDLPADKAAVMLTRERVITNYTPLDTKAHALVDMLRDPGLEERYASGGAHAGWYVLGPLAWWAEHRFQALSLNTPDGPARLGEAVAVVLGLTVTLGLVLGGVRSGRRKRAAAAGSNGRLPGDGALLACRFLFPATGVVVVIGSLVHLTTATLPQDEERDGPLPPATPPYVADTTRVDRIAEALRDDPLYVDPLAEQSARDLAGVGERVTEAELPIYTAVVPMSRFDESGGDPEILAHALHHVIGEDGVFVVVDGVTTSAVRVETALFGAGPGGDEDDWESDRALREVTGHQFDLTTVQALDNLMDVLADMSESPGAASPEPLSVASRAEPSPDPSRLSDFVSGGFLGALFGVGPLVALFVLALVWGVGRIGALMRTVPGRSLRPRADRAVRRASRALQTAPDTHPGRAEALREADAALAVLAGEPDELDLVGVTVLADRATRRLGSDPETATLADVPVCMVNPLHGPSVLRGVGRDEPLCAPCSALSEAQRRHRALRVAAPGGGRVPHLELDRRWVATGYGARGRLDVEDLLKESDVH